MLKNGYISKTLRTVQIGMKSTREWIGEDILGADNPATYLSPYTAKVVKKVVCFQVALADMTKIPITNRNMMIQAA
jgi:hypothetical protein